MLDQQFGQNSDLSGRLLSGRRTAQLDLLHHQP
jgi:hypothetical protein